MENQPILRSSAAEAGPAGTGRPASASSTRTADRERFDETLERTRSERASHEPRASERAAEPRRRPQTASSSSTRNAEPQASNATAPSNATPAAPLAQEPVALEGSGLAGGSSGESELQKATADGAKAPRPATTGATVIEPTAEVEASASLALRDTLQAELADAGEPVAAAPTAPTAPVTTTAPQEAPQPSLDFEDGSAGALEPVGEASETLEPLAEAQPEVASAASVAEPESAPAAARSEDAGTPIAPRDTTTRAVEPTPEASAAKATPAKEPPVSPERAADMLRQIRLQLTPGLRQATIQLEPRELGRISIKVTMRGDACHAELRVEKRSALDALERQLPELEAALERAGFGGGELSLELDLERRESRNATPELPSALPARATPAPAPRALAAALAGRIPASDGVDTYA